MMKCVKLQRGRRSRLPSPSTLRVTVLVVILALGGFLASIGARHPGIVAVSLTGSQGSAGAGSVPSGSGSTGTGGSAAGSSGTSQTSGSNGASGSSGSSSSGSSGSSSSGSSGSSSSGSSSATKTLLSSQSYAPYTYEVYPAKPSQQALIAETGFNIKVHPSAGGTDTISIQSQFSGGPSVTKSFLATDKVYWFEASFGDDAQGADVNLGDDGWLLTNAQGYITTK